MSGLIVRSGSSAYHSAVRLVVRESRRAFRASVGGDAHNQGVRHEQLVLSAAIAGSFVAGAAVTAQVVPRVFDNGSVWTVAYVDVKPGQNNAYMKFLRDVQLPRWEYRKKEGDILSYHVLSVMNPRDNDPDYVILAEFKNMAVFDRGPAYFEDLDRRMAGSAEAREAQLANVRQMTAPRGSMMAREVRFTQ